MKNRKKGFTLAELLIVVAIIAVLVAIAIPVFTSQLEKSRESTDMANIRSAYATLVAGYLDATTPTANSIKVPVMQKDDQNGTLGWAIDHDLEIMVSGSMTKQTVAARNSGFYTVAIGAAGRVTVT